MVLLVLQRRFEIVFVFELRVLECVEVLDDRRVHDDGQALGGICRLERRDVAGGGRPGEGRARQTVASTPPLVARMHTRLLPALPQVVAAAHARPVGGGHRRTRLLSLVWRRPPPPWRRSRPPDHSAPARSPSSRRPRTRDPVALDRLGGPGRAPRSARDSPARSRIRPRAGRVRAWSRARGCSRGTARAPERGGGRSRPRVERLHLAGGVVDTASNGLGSVPTEAIHCQLPLLLAWSPSISIRMNKRSPQRQSMPRSFVRNEPTTSRARLCIHPSRRAGACPRPRAGTR